jgi:hypothetical protein
MTARAEEQRAGVAHEDPDAGCDQEGEARGSATTASPPTNSAASRATTARALAMIVGPPQAASMLSRRLNALVMTIHCRDGAVDQGAEGWPWRRRRRDRRGRDLHEGRTFGRTVRIVGKPDDPHHHRAGEDRRRLGFPFREREGQEHRVGDGDAAEVRRQGGVRLPGGRMVVITSPGRNPRTGHRRDDEERDASGERCAS